MTIIEGLNKQLMKIKSEVLINLASSEYFKSVKLKELNAEITAPVFKKYKNGDYKMVGIYAKKVQGMLSCYIIQDKLTDPLDIKYFSVEGY